MKVNTGTFFSAAKSRIRSWINLDCTGEPPGELIEIATACRFFGLNAASSAFSTFFKLRLRPVRLSGPMVPTRSIWVTSAPPAPEKGSLRHSLTGKFWFFCHELACNRAILPGQVVICPNIPYLNAIGSPLLYPGAHPLDPAKAVAQSKLHAAVRPHFGPPIIIRGSLVSTGPFVKQ